MNQQSQILTISQLTRQIKVALEHPSFQQLKVEGEISNFVHHSSGHMYFTLKDDNSRIKAVMFRSRNAKLKFVPENGDTIIAVGSLGVYEPNGEYQIYVDLLLPQGIGMLHVKFEKLKQKLESKGLFAAERKKPLPFLPRKIGVITSPTGAAVRDIISVIKRRFPIMEILIVPAVVQGKDGPQSVVNALQSINSQPDIDLVILARGGGSIEELWTFNEEAVARAIAESRIPVISGIGHETDYTVADFVADHRGATPSAAAELAVPDYYHLSALTAQLRDRLIKTTFRQLNEKKTIVGYFLERGVLQRPGRRLEQEKQRVDELSTRLELMVKHHYRLLSQRQLRLVDKLDSLSPLATLSRGYAVCQNSTRMVITDPDQVRRGENITVRIKDGKLWCQVQKGERAEHDQG